MTFHLADALFWIAVACCCIAQVAIIRSIAISSPAGSSASPRANRGLELLWAVLPGLALAVVLVFTWRAMHPHA